MDLKTKLFYKSLGMKEDMLVLMEVLLAQICAWFGFSESMGYRTRFSKDMINTIRELQHQYFTAKKVWMKLQ